MNVHYFVILVKSFSRNSTRSRLRWNFRQFSYYNLRPEFGQYTGLFWMRPAHEPTRNRLNRMHNEKNPQIVVLKTQESSLSQILTSSRSKEPFWQVDGHPSHGLSNSRTKQITDLDSIGYPFRLLSYSTAYTAY